MLHLVGIQYLYVINPPASFKDTEIMGYVQSNMLTRSIHGKCTISNFFFVVCSTCVYRCFYPSELSSQQIAMGDQMHDSSNLETDDSEAFSLINSRLESFRGSKLVQQVPAERLARAGFYFIGPSDRVRCFSCHKTVENWHMGDRPVERHKEVSLSCTLLSFRMHCGIENDINLKLRWLIATIRRAVTTVLRDINVKNYTDVMK